MNLYPFFFELYIAFPYIWYPLSGKQDQTTGSLNLF